MKVKRWVLTTLVGVFVVSVGAVLTAAKYTFISTLGIVWIVCGIVLIVMGMSKTIVSLLTLFLPAGERELVNILYKRGIWSEAQKLLPSVEGMGFLI